MLLFVVFGEQALLEGDVFCHLQYYIVFHYFGETYSLSVSNTYYQQLTPSSAYLFLIILNFEAKTVEHPKTPYNLFGYFQH